MRAAIRRQAVVELRLDLRPPLPRSRHGHAYHQRHRHGGHGGAACGGGGAQLQGDRGGRGSAPQPGTARPGAPRRARGTRAHRCPRRGEARRGAPRGHAQAAAPRAAPPRGAAWHRTLRPPPPRLAHGGHRAQLRGASAVPRQAGRGWSRRRDRHRGGGRGRSLGGVSCRVPGRGLRHATLDTADLRPGGRRADGGTTRAGD
mmetsp:Transcript_65049/g.156940  ORF Transcript_65049/g.156940 Transcript_65049/m.156940 type:complete len:202 (+) Transcript_65049:773-1378(+)